jgi:putative transposase
MIRTLHEGLLADGIAVPLTKLCAWFGVPRRTVYYKPTKAAPTVDPRFAEPIKAMIEKEPSFGYRTVAWLLGFNKNTVQRVFQIKGWQVRKRPIGMRPRIEAVPSVATAPNERWSTDLCRVWAGRDGWATLALVIDCHTRELLGWHLSRSGKATTAASALEHALINRFGTLGKVPHEFLLRSDNGLPTESGDLWDAVIALNAEDRSSLFAHCVSQSLNAVQEAYNRRPKALAHADLLATCLHLDMAAVGWQPTVDTYFGRVTKARILQAVQEAKGEAAARMIDHLKKPEMASAAEKLLADSSWLPAPLRTQGQVFEASPNGSGDTDHTGEVQSAAIGGEPAMDEPDDPADTEDAGQDEEIIAAE